ncbi:Ankyrin repeat domain-containing protein [Lachnellula suecica]|uniref:Ankyrin repeat domain-containing protein n=1 Tax=Lachnellula suecica TaxID=602035 RepID=A0A8T9CET5_9HELO|nr:Ankyrin repeat domain-containing protein [Lachnellula suecica]
MEIMGLHLSQLRRLPQIFPDNEQLRLFMVEARNVFVQAGERKGKNHLRAITPVGLSTMIKLIWKPFKVQFGDLRTKLGECMTKIDHEISLAEMEEAHAERVRAAQDRITQGDRWEETEKFHKNWQDQMEENGMEKVIKWLAPADVTSNHTASAKLRYGTTGSWFLEGHLFQTWLNDDNSPLFWLHAIPGAGKTVLTSSVINYLKHRFQSEEVGLAYFYCDYKDPMKQDPAVVLRTLLSQLSNQNIEVFQNVQKFYREQCKDDRTADMAPPSLDLVRSNFGPLLESSFQKVFIVIDAIDECHDRECISNAISAITNSLDNVKILVSSREDKDIKGEFGDFPNLQMRAQHVSGDIESYVDARLKERIASKKLKVKDDDLRKQISDTLVLKADGMFQWINCQIDHLCKFKTHNAIREALKSLPKTLEDTYLRILQSIEEVDSAAVQKLLKWLVRGTRELTMKELASAIAVDPQAENDCLDPDDLMDPEDIVGLCSSLLVVSDDHIVSLAHFTVKEFLTSPRIKDTLSIYYIGNEKVHAELAEICLTYLGYREFDRTPLATVDEMADFLSEFAFLEYASKFWATHAYLVSTSENQIYGLIENLFHSSSRQRFNYDLWLQIYHLQHRRNGLSLNQPVHSTPLYYASLFGLPVTVESILDEGFELDNVDDKKDNPLLASSAAGHADVVEILLDRCFKDRPKENLAVYLYLAASNGHGDAVEVLLSGGAPIESKGGKYGTSLQVSSLEGNPDAVKVLLKRGANFKVVDPRFGMPLAAAAEKGHRQVVQILLDFDAPINGRGGWYSTPLISAIVGKDDSIINKMLDYGANVNAQGGRHDCALMAAAALGKVDLVKKLIDLGAKVNDENDKGADALHSACCAGRLDVVELLLASGADVNAKGGKHRNALNAASAEGYIDIVRTLLQAGADPHATDSHYGNCLQAAAFNGHEDIVRVLAEAGVDVKAAGGVRGTALVSAAASGNIEMIDLLVEMGIPKGKSQDMTDALVTATWKQQESLVRHVLDLGADIDDTGTLKADWWSPLSVAAFKGNKRLVEMLLEFGADVSAQAGLHGTVLIAAVNTDHCDHSVVEVIIAAGADVNEETEPEDSSHAGSALVAAVRRGDIKVVNMLLDHGAEPNSTRSSCYSPLMDAIDAENEPIIDLLIERGADINFTIEPCPYFNMDGDEDDGTTSALDLAAKKNSAVMIRKLVEQGALLEQPRDDTAFKTPLQCAAYHGNPEAAAALMKLGCDIHPTGGTFGSALQAAVCSGSAECVTLLLDAGANIDDHHTGKHGSALIAACVINWEKLEVLRILIARGVDVNTNAGGDFPYAIIAMVSTGYADGVRALIEAGADVKKYGGKYHSAIQASALQGDIEVAEILLDAGADVNATGGMYSTALQCAYRDGYYNLIPVLYERGASHAIDGGVWGSALGSAIGGACHTLVHQFVRRHKVNVNQSCGKWGSPLHFIIYQRSYDEEALVDLFLDANADVNALGGCYSTPLGAAVAEGEEGVFERLLEMGADPNLVDEKYARDPLFLACQEQKGSYVDQLIEKGADVNAYTKRGSVLQSAAFNSNSEEGGLNILEKLISHGAGVNAITKGPYGTTLNAATVGGDFGTVKWLLEHGVDINLIGGHFGSALQASASNASLKISRLLFKHGANVNGISGRYRTALQAACAAGDIYTAKLLLNHGADPNIKGGRYGTALQAACVAQNTDLVRLLLARGADPKITGGRYGNAFTAAVMMGEYEVVKILLAEEGVNKDMLGERKGHYKDHMWEGCEEFIDEVLADEEPLEEFQEDLIEVPDESEDENTTNEEDVAENEEEEAGWETDGDGDGEDIADTDDAISALSWLKVECGPGGDFDE